MLPQIHGEFRLVADPELRFTQAGKAVCSFRVAASDSRKDQAGNWETTEQIFIGVSLWETDAEQAAETLQKGDPVVITGRLYQREYDDRDGNKRTSLEFKFPAVGKVIKGARGQAQGSPPPRQAAPAGDPWASAPAGGAGNGSEPPF